MTNFVWIDGGEWTGCLRASETLEIRVMSIVDMTDSEFCCCCYCFLDI